MARSKSNNGPSRKSTPPRAAATASEPPAAKSTPPKAKRSKSVSAAAPSTGNGAEISQEERKGGRAHSFRASALPVKPWVSTPPSPDAIAARAYELYVQSGYEHGHDEEHWLQAERELTPPS